MTTDHQQEGASLEEALQALILDRDLERLEDLLAEFNLFDVLGIARQETQHSAFLAWLLDPRGSHGLRDYFLRGFLTQAAAEARGNGILALTPLDVDSWKLRDIKVATERHNIDILLIDENDGFVCLIENKIGSGEHSNQLNRYLTTVEREYEGLTTLPIFLTPEGTEPAGEEDAKRYVPMAYGAVADLIDRALNTRGSTIGASVASFLAQYVRSLRRRVLNSSDNIDTLAYQLYNNHREAIDRIITAKSLPATMTLDIVDSAMEQGAPDLQHDFHSQGCRRFFSPSLEEIPDLKDGTRWTKSGRIVLFEFWHGDELLRLAVVVGPGPQETRERLHELSQRGEGPWNPESKMKRHFKMYRKPILSQQDHDPFDLDMARPKIEKAIADFYSNDYWPIVNAIREEFGLSPVGAG